MKDKNVYLFFLLVLFLSIPFWVFGAYSDRIIPQDFPIRLPLSSLMVFCPLIAGLILSGRDGGSGGVKSLLRRALDFGKIHPKTWFIPILGIMPLNIALLYIMAALIWVPIPEWRTTIEAALVFLPLTLIAAYGEELGWQGYIFDRLSLRWNALTVSLLVGGAAVIWHFIPFLQTGRPLGWILWQCTTLMLLRIPIAWLYNNTGRSVFAAVLFHATINMTTLVFPIYDWYYAPMVSAIFLALLAIAIVSVWGAEDLASYRFARKVGAAEDYPLDVETT